MTAAVALRLAIVRVVPVVPADDPKLELLMEFWPAVWPWKGTP